MTHREGAQEFTGPEVIELLLKPYDIGQFISAVKKAVTQSAAGHRETMPRAQVPATDSPLLSS
jgi:hypothetical protein